jgi:hypothetical protein
MKTVPDFIECVLRSFPLKVPQLVDAAALHRGAWPHEPDGAPQASIAIDNGQHRRCGDLDGGVEAVTVWLACECGAAIARRADERDALDVSG